LCVELISQDQRALIERFGGKVEAKVNSEVPCKRSAATKANLESK
jgi:hypothetical protein